MTITNQMLESLSVEELTSLNNRVVELIRWKRKMESIDIRNELVKGMTVTVNHPKLRGKALVVSKINRTKAVLREGNRNWTVPMNLIEIV